MTLKSRNGLWGKELEKLVPMAQTEFPVLLWGPSGSGKELLAKEIHNLSPRKFGPYVCVNCSALSETLIESELFGHKRGSFTGAMNDRKGAFEAARRGTLFLDEIGDLPLSLQAKLLRAIDNQEIRAVGSDLTQKTDVRVIAATHRDLKSMSSKGEFRKDLYFRLNILKLSPPALCERMEDFDDLAYEFARSYRVRFSFDAMLRLKKHPWPGNIRELRNLVMRASAFFGGQLVTPEMVEELLDPVQDEQPENLALFNMPLQEIERRVIAVKLHQNNGNQRKTSRDLGIPKSTLHDRIRELGIEVPRGNTLVNREVKG
jgi:DNA-binding NtrC family response regulator